MENSNIQTIIYWEHDPGHGWLAVPLKECKRVNILKDISIYSYYDKETLTVYLEEDCDAALYLDSIKWHENKLPGEKIAERFQENTLIRALPSFNASAIK
jgi:hypothetical protein